MNTTQPYIREITFIGRTRVAFFRRGDNTEEHKEHVGGSETIFHNFDEMSPDLFSSFEKFIGQARNDNETFKY
jgi:hypothetical protein